jgi:hypothetical protein
MRKEIEAAIINNFWNTFEFFFKSIWDIFLLIFNKQLFFFFFEKHFKLTLQVDLNIEIKK